MFWFLFYALIYVAPAQAQTSSVSLHSEVQQIEKVKASRPLFAEERSRLAQLYFLSSDCAKLKVLLTEDRENPLDPVDKDLSCACDGKCDLSQALNNKGRVQERFYALRQLIVGGAGMKDTHVKKLWESLKDEPEARYFMFQTLKNSKSAEEKSFATQQYQSLRPLNVEP